MRQRVLRGLETGALRDGTRLPGLRELAAELHSNPRTIAAVYRALAADGLVTLKPRSGAFISHFAAGRSETKTPPQDWLADVLARTVEQGISVQAFADVVRRIAATGDVNAVVVANIVDQVEGLARELREDFGFRTSGVLLDSLVRGERLPRALMRAHLLVTTESNSDRVRALAERSGKKHVVACIRDDLLSANWLALLQHPVYVIVADPRFGDIAREFVGRSADASQLVILVAGHDSLDIPPDAPTYITEAARARLGATRLPGRLIAPARVLTVDCARQIASVFVERKLGARGGSEGSSD